MANLEKIPAKDTGFTLIEVIIAMSILVILFTVTTTVFMQIATSKKLLDDRRDTKVITNSILTRMTHELQLAQSGTALLPDPNNMNQPNSLKLNLRGQKISIGNGLRGDSITFLAEEGGQYVPGGNSHGGMVQITYRVAEDPDNPSGDSFLLIREEVPNVRPYKKAFENAMVFPITHDLLELSFRYFDPENVEWVDEWGDGSRLKLPSIVEFSVALKSPLGNVERFTTAVALRASNDDLT